MSYLYDVGQTLKTNIMNGQPTRTKSYTEYRGLVIPPCGEFAPGCTISSPPWKAFQTTKPGYSQLHSEITGFVRYIQPTAKEALVREDLITRFTSLVKRLSPGTTVQAVGSSVTGLAFPTSDIDMVATFPCSTSYRYSTPRLNLSDLEYKLRGSGFASKIESVLQASVPLIRVADAKTGIQIDLTASDSHGVRATRTVQEWLRDVDATVIESLVKVLKLFLATRRLGTTYTGGVNSYMLTWMVIAWAKLEMPKLQSVSPARGRTYDDLVASMGSMSLGSSSTVQRRAGGGDVDLGSALKAFLKFYGEEFLYSTRSISFVPGSGFHYSTKRDGYSRYVSQAFLLTISDPADTLIDLGAKAYAIKHMQATFLHAYNQIVQAEEGGLTRSELRLLQVQGTLGFILGGDYAKMEESRRRVSGK